MMAKPDGNTRWIRAQSAREMKHRASDSLGCLPCRTGGAVSCASIGSAAADRLPVGQCALGEHAADVYWI